VTGKGDLNVGRHKACAASVAFMMLGAVIAFSSMSGGFASANPVRLGCTDNPLYADGKRNVVQFRLKCNYPIHELSLRIGPDSLEVADEPEQPTIVGAVRSEVSLRPARNWHAELGPFVEPPSPSERAHQRMKCRRRPKLPRGVHHAFVQCIGQVQPGTVMSGSFETLVDPCGEWTEIGESSSRFNVCHRRCIPWGFGSAGWRRVRCP